VRVTGIDRGDPRRIVVLLAAVASIAQYAAQNGADQDVARVTLADGRVLGAQQRDLHRAGRAPALGSTLRLRLKNCRMHGLNVVIAVVRSRLLPVNPGRSNSMRLSGQCSGRDQTSPSQPEVMKPA
jgi:hypothetical protein